MRPKLVDWHVSQCACGHITLRLGTVQMEFTKREFAELFKLVGEGMDEFNIEPSERQPIRLSTVRH